MYPPSPPRLSRYRPAVVSGCTGATTSTNVSPAANTALVRPNWPTPGSWKGGAQPKVRLSSSATWSQSRATRATWRRRGPLSTPPTITGQQGRTALVTGANSGIGFQAAVELARHGAVVLMAGRDPGRGADARRAPN